MSRGTWPAGRDAMQDQRCGECGQTFKTPDELENHVERVHGAPKPEDALAAEPPNEVRR